MHSRRTFLRNSAAFVPAMAFAGRHAFAAAGHIPIGVQLYTVRKEAQQDLPRVLEQIARIGYQEVEAYDGLYTTPAATLSHIVVDAGLTVPSAHFNYNDLDAHFNYAKELGASWMVCSMIDPSLWGSAQGFATAAQKFNEWGQRAKDFGLRFAFHNHDYEFRPFSTEQAGKTGYDILLESTDPNLVFFEVDCYWVAQAGIDPLTLLRRLGPRLKMLHLKDRKAGFPSSYVMNQDSAHFVPVGSGTLDWKAIIEEGKRLGVEHYFVEQDQTAIPPIDALRKSYEYLSRIM